MKIVRYRSQEGPRTGVLADDSVLDLGKASEGRIPTATWELLRNETALSDAHRLYESALEDPELRGEFAAPLEEVDLLAPVEGPEKVICLGLNYLDHAEESGHEAPDEPVIFAKLPSSVIGPGDDIVLPAVSEKVDYEVELAFIAGKQGKDIPAGKAMGYIAGYTVLNDVSARDYQHEKPGGQWLLGKSFDTFCPIGPWIVTPDEIEDPHNLELTCSVNGEVLQSSDTSNMLFRIPQIIEYISRVFTLQPGDVVATGTPAGVGMGRTPPRYLQSGDEVACTVQHIGTLRNAVK